MSSFDKAIANARDARNAGDAAASLAHYREALAVSSNDAERAHSLRHIGDLARELSRNAEALAALKQAEVIYKGSVHDTLSLANTVRLLAVVEGSATRWQEARRLYMQAADDTSFDLRQALAECDRHIG